MNSGLLMLVVLFRSTPNSLHGLRLVLFPGGGQVLGTVHLEPSLLADVGDGDALYRVVHEHLGNDVTTAFGEEVGEAV